MCRRSCRLISIWCRVMILVCLLNRRVTSRRIRMRLRNILLWLLLIVGRLVIGRLFRDSLWNRVWRTFGLRWRLETVLMLLTWWLSYRRIKSVLTVSVILSLIFSGSNLRMSLTVLLFSMDRFMICGRWWPYVLRNRLRRLTRFYSLLLEIRLSVVPSRCVILVLGIRVKLWQVRLMVRKW